MIGTSKEVKKDFEESEQKNVLGAQEMTAQEIRNFIDGIANDSLPEEMVIETLLALTDRGPTAKEITEIATVMREKAFQVPVPPALQESLLDTCGTGGGERTANISTTVALLAASAGIPVAKHGSTAVSSLSGSADVLTQLGVNINLKPEEMGELIDSTGISFLYANLLHPVMGKVFPYEQRIAKEHGKKTIFFTIIGPLINPAGAARHVMGVYKPELVSQVAEVALRLNFKHALIVHGTGGKGFDEISPVAETQVAEVKDGQIRQFVIDPSFFGLQRHDLASIQGGSPAENARLLQGIVDGQKTGPQLDTVLMNAAAALYVGGKATDLLAGYQLAKSLIESGAVKEKLAQLIERSHSFGDQEKAK